MTVSTPVRAREAPADVPVPAEPAAAASWRSQTHVFIVLGIGVVALGLLFRQEAAAAVGVWMASTAYNHCFLIIPIAAYLLWDRRDTVRGCVAKPWPLAVVGGLPLAVAWLLAERLGIMEGRQLVVMSFVELLLLAVLGWRLWWQLAGPLLYLYFLVPFGGFLTPRLQDVTTDFVRHGLNLLHIPAYIDGYSIQIAEGTFYIAEACAGLRFLIASMAFGALYALLMYRRPLRRIVFIGVSFLVPIVANGLRALGIVVLGHLLGSAKAGATDHVLYGWMFFSIVILILIVLGLPFREDLDRPANRTPAAARTIRDDGRGWAAAAVAAALAVAVAAISPAVAAQLDRLGRPPMLSVQALHVLPGCSDLPAEPAAQPGNGLGAQVRMTSRRVACDGIVYDVTLAVFSPHVTAAPVVAVANRLGDLPQPPDDEGFVEITDWPKASPGAPRLWQVNRTDGPGPVRAIAIWVGGSAASGGLPMRIHLARTSLTGAARVPVVLGVRPELHGSGITPAVAPRLRAFLLAPDFDRQVRRLLEH